jgi:RHS repeat-associated protein
VWYDRLHDVLGSVVALTNSVRQVVERYDYDPYGTTTIMDAAAVPLALKPIDPAAADGYYHDHDRDGDIDAADYTDLMDCVNNTPYDPMCIYTHDRTGDRRVDIVDVGVYLAYADDQGLAGGTSAPELVHYGRPLRLQFDADGDGRVDMFDWYAMQTCFTKNTTRCNYLFDDNGDGVVNFYDLTDFKQAADGPQGGPGATQWRRKLVASRYGNPFMWTGQRYDATTGQYHFWARTYSPRLGRWMQRDPIGYIDGPNLYATVAGNPLRFTDRLGLTKNGLVDKGVVDSLWWIIRQRELELQEEQKKLGREIDALNKLLNLIYDHKFELSRKLREIEAEFTSLMKVYLDGGLAGISGIYALFIKGRLAKLLGIFGVLMSIKGVQDWRIHTALLKDYFDFIQADLEAWLRILERQIDYIYRYLLPKIRRTKEIDEILERLRRAKRRIAELEWTPWPVGCN